MTDNLQDPNIYCNPIIWLDECEEGMTKWNAEICNCIICCISHKHESQKSEDEYD